MRGVCPTDGCVRVYAYVHTHRETMVPRWPRAWLASFKLAPPPPIAGDKFGSELAASGRLWPCIVVAYIVVAYIAMPHAVMACVALTYEVMSYNNDYYILSKYG